MQKRKSVAILDLGSHKMTVLVGQQGVNNIFNIQGIGEAAYAGFSGGEFLEKDALLDAVRTVIEQAENQIKDRITDVFVGVPGEFTTAMCYDSFITFKGKRRKVTDIDVQELYAASGIKTGEYVLINSAPIFYALDDNKKELSPVGMISGKISGTLSYIYAEKNFLTLMDGILDSLNLSHRYISSVLAEAMLLFEERERQVLFADIGYITTSVALMQGEGLLMLKSFSAGGAHVAADLMACLNIPFDAAEQLKNKIRLGTETSEEEMYTVIGQGGSMSIPVRDANDIAEARVEALAQMIARCIAKHPQPVARHLTLYITGGGISYMRGAADIISRVTGRNVEIAVPPLPQINRPNLSSCYGVLNLALKQAEPVKKSFWQRLFGK